MGKVTAKFLGKELVIKCMNVTGAASTSPANANSANYVKVEQGETKVLKAGESTTYGAYTLTVDSVDSQAGSAMISVASGSSKEAQILNKDSTYFFLSGLDVKLQAVTSGSAQLTLGSAVEKTIYTDDTDGWFGNKDYDVKIGRTADLRPYIELQYAPDTALTGTNALDIGKELKFINDVFYLKAESMKATTPGTITVKYSAGVTACNLWTKTDNLNVIEVNFPTATEGNTAANATTDANAVRGSGDNTQTVYLYTADMTKLSVTYKKPDLTCGGVYNLITPSGGAQNSSVILYDGKYKDTIVQMVVATNATNSATWDMPYLFFRTYQIGKDTTKYDQVGAYLTTSAAKFSRVGSTTAVATDAVYNSTLPSTPTQLVSKTDYNIWLGTKDKDFITTYGIKVPAVKSKVESGTGSLELQVPELQDKVAIFVGKSGKTSYTGKTVGDTISGVTIDAINVAEAKKATTVAITLPVAAVDTEVTEPTKDDLILVGGPSVNSLVAQLGLTKEDFKKGETGVGKLVFKANAFGGEKSAIVVAGWDAENTRASAWVLAHYKTYTDNLKDKTDVTVTGTGTTGLEVA
jgi:hypothetical protein